MAEPDDFEARWQILKGRFVERLVERMAAITQAWRTIEADPAGAGDARSTLFHQVHSLAGAGATFGFEDLSSAARSLEPYVDPLRHDERKPLPEAAEIARRLALLHDAVRAINPLA